MLRAWRISRHSMAGTLPKFAWSTPRGGRQRRCKMPAVPHPLFVVVRASSAVANAVATAGTQKITTVGRDKVPDTETSEALSVVGAGELGHSALVSRARGGDDFVVFVGYPSTSE